MRESDALRCRDQETDGSPLTRDAPSGKLMPWSLASTALRTGSLGGSGWVRPRWRLRSWSSSSRPARRPHQPRPSRSTMHLSRPATSSRRSTRRRPVSSSTTRMASTEPTASSPTWSLTVARTQVRTSGTSTPARAAAASSSTTRTPADTSTRTPAGSASTSATGTSTASRTTTRRRSA